MRNHAKKFWPLLCLLSLIIFLTGCGSAQNARITMYMNQADYMASLNTAQPQMDIAEIFTGKGASVYAASLPTQTPTVSPEIEPTLPPTSSALVAETPPTGESKKVAYLTFDDGPSKYTDAILDILKEENVPATFFVIGANIQGREEQIRRIHNEGHKVANHTYSHDTDIIYASTEAFLADLKKCEEEIQKVLPGYFSDVIRFPKGSGYKNAKNIREEINAYGYHYYDWSVLNGDAETSRKRSVEELTARFMETLDASSRRQHITILMHDTNTKENTVKMLKGAIQELKNRGYELRVLPETDD